MWGLILGMVCAAFMYSWETPAPDISKCLKRQLDLLEVLEDVSPLIQEACSFLTTQMMAGWVNDSHVTSMTLRV